MKYKYLVPKSLQYLEMMSKHDKFKEIPNKIEELMKIELKDKNAEDFKDDARFCLNFVIENILHWESIPRRTWYELFSY